MDDNLTKMIVLIVQSCLLPFEFLFYHYKTKGEKQHEYDRLFIESQYVDLYQQHFHSIKTLDHTEIIADYLRFLYGSLFNLNLDKQEFPPFTNGILFMFDHLFGVLPTWWRSYRLHLPPIVTYVDHIFSDFSDKDYQVTAPHVIICTQLLKYNNYEDDNWPCFYEEYLANSETVCSIQHNLEFKKDYYRKEYYSIELNMRENRTRYAMTTALLCAEKSLNSINSSIWYAIADNFYHFTAMDEKVNWININRPLSY